MDLPTLDYAGARDRMVDGQIRPNKVIDPRVIRAMRHLPRERFLPAGLASLAYADEDIPLPNGRALMEPMVLARLVQLARVRPGERALVVGAGAGYGAAVIAECGASVTALEQDAELLARARSILPALAPTVTVVEGPLEKGWPDTAGWDVVMIEGAVHAIPEAIALQVRPAGGRLVTVLAQDPGVGQAVLAEPVNPATPNKALRAQAHFSCATPLLQPLIKPPAFTF